MVLKAYLQISALNYFTQDPQGDILVRMLGKQDNFYTITLAPQTLLSHLFFLAPSDRTVNKALSLHVANPTYTPELRKVLLILQN